MLFFSFSVFSQIDSNKVRDIEPIYHSYIGSIDIKSIVKEYKVKEIKNKKGENLIVTSLKDKAYFINNYHKYAPLLKSGLLKSEFDNSRIMKADGIIQIIFGVSCFTLTTIHANSSIKSYNNKWGNGHTAMAILSSGFVLSGTIFIIKY